MANWLWVALGGAAGSVARYGLGVQAGRWLGHGWPWGTFAANVAGGLAMGALAAWLVHRGGGDQERWRLLLGVGLLGGFTTFSAFSLETVLMIERRETAAALLYVFLSVMLAIGAVFLGLFFGRRLFA